MQRSSDRILTTHAGSG